MKIGYQLQMLRTRRWSSSFAPPSATGCVAISKRRKLRFSVLRAGIWVATASLLTGLLVGETWNLMKIGYQLKQDHSAVTADVAHPSVELVFRAAVGHGMRRHIEEKEG
jgi:hypothetical protein